MQIIRNKKANETIRDSNNNTTSQTKCFDAKFLAFSWILGIFTFFTQNMDAVRNLTSLTQTFTFCTKKIETDDNKSSKLRDWRCIDLFPSKPKK